MGVSVSVFGNLSTGEEVHCYHLENEAGAYADVLDYGAILAKLCVPDRRGVLTDVVLGYDDLASYEVNGCFFGATIGRNGNRIAGAEFSIGDKSYTLSKNEFGNNLHSGPNGFEKKLWTGTPSEEANAVTMSRLSPDGENGFPGNFNVSVTYELTEDNELRITYEGECDQDTVANMTNHSYFNLNGEGAGSILEHMLTIHAEYFTPVQDKESIPTGEYRPVEGTVMDFRKPKAIGDKIGALDEQLGFTGGYDHNFVTDFHEIGAIREIASVYSKKSGIVMTVFSDEPCVQFYAGNFVRGEKGKGGHVYYPREGFCLETQVEPNAVNMPSFHSPILSAGEKYLSHTAYRFRCD